MSTTIKISKSLIVLVIFLLTGCSYTQNRIMDLTDVPIIEAHYKNAFYGLATEVQVGPIGFPLGFSDTVHTPIRLRDLPNLENDSLLGVILLGTYGNPPPWSGSYKRQYFLVFNIKSFIDSNENIELNKEGVCVNKTFRLYGRYENPKEHKIDYLRMFDISAFGFLGIGGVRIGVSPGELFDFILGFLTIDIAGDDDKDK